MGRTIGIDLGTTNSAMAVLDGGEPVIIQNSEGDHTTPSVVAWQNDGTRIVGKAALHQQVTNYKNTVYSVKRFIGRQYSELDPLDLDGLMYDLKPGEKGRPMITANGRQMFPEEVSAAVLAKLKADAEKALGEEITDAVITVPAAFNEVQRQATKDAGRIAGLNVTRLVDEPTAAALAYGFGESAEGFGGDQGTNILVFDLGGGTFDVSVLSVGDGVVSTEGTDGDAHLGGDIWDTTLCQWVLDRIEKDFGVRVEGTSPQSLMQHSRVLEASRQAKEMLSSATSTRITLPFFGMDAQGAPINVDYELTRDQFNQITHDLFERCRGPIEGALQHAGMSKSDIDVILMVGGSSRMPAANDLVREMFGKEPNCTKNPDEVVAMGAAIQGGIQTGECSGLVLIDVTSLSLGVKVVPDTMDVLIPKGTQKPADSDENLYTTAEDNQRNVEIELFQGEEPVASANKKIGDAVLPLEPAPAGVPRIALTISIDVNGLIHLHAVDKATGHDINPTFRSTTGIDEGEIKALAAKVASEG